MTVYTLIYTTELWLYTLILGLSLDNKSIEEVSIRECLCVISQFSPGMGCHENIAGSCKVRSRADGVVKEVVSFVSAHNQVSTCGIRLDSFSLTLTTCSSFIHTPDSKSSD